MTPYNPLEDRLQSIERRVTDLEDERFECPECGCKYPSYSAANRCCRD